MARALATSTGKGTLYLVATPIGNKEDITLRALSTLQEVDLILAEDTRHSQQLLAHFGIKNKLSSFHAFNEGEKGKQMLAFLLEGKSIALISDAGTPLICDPGFPLVRNARENDIPVTPIPGACALITALSASGVACDSFTFLGFLPAKQSLRKNKLLALKNHQHTLIFYESTHRILECLEDISAIFGIQFRLTLAKELTKSFEKIISGSIEEIVAWLLSEPEHTKGEFVLILPATPPDKDSNAAVDILGYLLEELPLKQAVALACKITKDNKNELYALALQIKETLSQKKSI